MYQPTNRTLLRNRVKEHAALLSNVPNLLNVTSIENSNDSVSLEVGTSVETRDSHMGHLLEVDATTFLINKNS